MDHSEVANGGALWEKVFLEMSQNSQKNTCARASFWKKFIKKETLAQMFSCEFCENSKSTLFTEHLDDCFLPLFTDPDYTAWSMSMFWS